MNATVVLYSCRLTFAAHGDSMILLTIHDSPPYFLYLASRIVFFGSQVFSSCCRKIVGWLQTVGRWSGGIVGWLQTTHTRPSLPSVNHGAPWRAYPVDDVMLQDRVHVVCWACSRKRRVEADFFVIPKAVTSKRESLHQPRAHNLPIFCSSEAHTAHRTPHLLGSQTARSRFRINFFLCSWKAVPPRSNERLQSGAEPNRSGGRLVESGRTFGHDAASPALLLFVS